MPEPTYILDANWWSFLFLSGHADSFAQAMGTVRCMIPTEIRDEVDHIPSRQGAFSTWCHSDGRALQVVDLLAGSAEQQLLSALMRASANPGKDLGERACIALASGDPSRVFVNHDKGACFLALRELPLHPQPVCSIAAFLRRLGDRRLLSRVAIEAIAHRARQSQSPPTWWSSWLPTVP
ncbi:MAG: hypothetical protein HY909_14255 [Deltaproteobacteria bacterium]|nr:hypothetical protein [Deltaproteobacteria bacterium]